MIVVVMPRFCSECGGEVDPNDKFCGNCGHVLEAGEEVVAGQSTTAGQSTAVSTEAPVAQAGASGVGSTTMRASAPGVGLVTLEPTIAGVPVRQALNKRQKRVVAISVLVGVLVIALILLVGVGVRLGKKYYFDEEVYGGQSGEVATSGGSSKKKKYNTVIVHDNVYSGVSISDDTDAYALIENDSVSQKNQCPSEIRRIEEEFITRFGITAVNLCEMDVAFARELENVFQKIYSEYPGARGYITNLTLVNTTMSESYIAAFMPAFSFATADTTSTYPWVMKTQVLLNSAYFLNQERLDASAKNGSESGHFPKNATIYSPVAHELGHYLSFLAMMKHYDMDSILLVDGDNMNVFYEVYQDFAKGDYSLEMIEEAYRKYQGDTGDSISLDDWRGTISNYALAKDNSGDYIYDETIAESFHDVYLNGGNASTASKYVVEVLKERLGQ